MKHRRYESVGIRGELDRRMDELNLLYKILNEVKRSCAYSEKEMESDIARLRKQGIDEEEIQLILRLWELKRKKGREFIELVKKLVEEVEKNER